MATASMRPPEFTGGNGQDKGLPGPAEGASMRPPEFTGGNAGLRGRFTAPPHTASMRPPEFTGGNRRASPTRDDRQPRFNEAAGIHRRKPSPSTPAVSTCAGLQ